MTKQSFSSLLFAKSNTPETRGAIIAAIHQMGKQQLRDALLMAVEEAAALEYIQSKIISDDSGFAHIKQVIDEYAAENHPRRGNFKSEEERNHLVTMARKDLDAMVSEIDELRFSHGNI